MRRAGDKEHTADYRTSGAVGQPRARNKTTVSYPNFSRSAPPTEKSVNEIFIGWRRKKCVLIF
jgi:hypothetical protein